MRRDATVDPSKSTAYISTHAPRVRRDESCSITRRCRMISTHAPRVRRDPDACSAGIRIRISTHAPRVRRDIKNFANNNIYYHFYSRASCEARPHGTIRLRAFSNFYSRASCEARPQHYVIILQSQPISCTRRTFLSFFLHHFDEYTEDKLLFKANLPAFFESFHLRLTMFSQYYDSFRIISFFCSNVFYSSLPVIP